MPRARPSNTASSCPPAPAAALPPGPGFLWAWSEGGDILTPDRRTCLLDSPPTIRAFQRFRDMRFKDGVSPTPADAAASAFMFESGNIAMDFNFMGMSPALS